LYVSAWSGHEIVVIDRRSGARHSIPVDFMPDNIKRDANGKLFVAGQRSTAATIGACRGPSCPQNWLVARVDPRRGTVVPLITRPGNELINYASGAFAVDGTLFITGRGDHRLAYVPLDGLPSMR
jgi:sugar lactone lactonase YvrE